MIDEGEEKNLQIQVHQSDQVFSDLEVEWNALAQVSDANLIFLTWEWQSTWWRAYHPGALWLLSVRSDAGELLAIAPWFIQTNAEQERVVRTIGCVDVTDYLSILIHQEHQTAVYEALAQFLIEQQGVAFDVLDFCNIPETASLLEGFRAALEAVGLSVSVKEQDVCPVIELPDSFADYVQNLDKKQRHELRRKMRKIDGLGDGVEWYIVDDRHDLATETAHFLALMRSASEEKASFLENEQHVAFFEAMVPLMFEKGWLQMAFIKLEDAYAAAYLNFVYNNEVLVYNSGLDIEVSKTLSPGIALLGYLIRHAIENGHKRFDFLRGDEQYKYHMGGQDTRVMNLIVRPALEA